MLMVETRTSRFSREEIAVLVQSAKTGDQDALLQLVASIVPYLKKTARKYSRYRHDQEGLFEDLFQEGIVGLLLALRNYLPELSSLLYHSHLWIKRRMLTFVLNSNSVTDLTPRVQGRIFQIKKIAWSRGQYLDKETLTEILAELGIKAEETIRSTENALACLTVVEIDNLFHLYNPEDTSVSEEYDHHELREALDQLLSTLSFREEAILRLRFFRDMPLHIIGGIFGVSGERVRQIEVKALRKLRHPTKIKKLAAFQ